MPAKLGPRPLVPREGITLRMKGRDEFLRTLHAMEMAARQQPGNPNMEEWIPLKPPAGLSAAKESPQQELDVRQIPFGVEIEMGGFSWEDLKEALEREEIPVSVYPKGTRKSGWDPRDSWSMDYDGSVSTDPDYGGEMSSRIMTLEDGGLEEIRKVFRIMRKCGGKEVPSAGFHVHVGAREIGLTPRALANLVKLELANETIIYRIAQNGQPAHRDDLHEDDPLGHTKKYCKPLSTANLFPLLHASSRRQAKESWYQAFPENTDLATGREFEPGHRRHPSRNTGFNLNSYWYRGTIEFRIFNCSDNVEDYITNILFALHMVKYAVEKDFELEEVHPWSKERNLPVSVAQLNRFLDTVVGKGQLKEDLTRLFLRSGGKVTQENPSPDPTKLMARYLGRLKYRFNTSGTELTPVEAVEAVNQCGFPVEALAPWGQSTLIQNSEALSHYLSQQVLISRGDKLEHLAKQDPGIAAGLQMITRLAEAGTRFHNVAGDEIPVQDGTIPYLTLLMGSPLRVVFPGEQAPVEIEDLGELQQADQILHGDTSRLNNQERERLDLIQILQKQGVVFWRASFEFAIPCKSALTVFLRFEKDRISAVLPHRIWWHAPLRRHVTVRENKDLEALTTRLAQRSLQANLP